MKTNSYPSVWGFSRRKWLFFYRVID